MVGTINYQWEEISEIWRKRLIVLITVSCYLNLSSVESMPRILHCINLNCITGTLEQQYILTAIGVIQFQAGQQLDIEAHKAVFW